MTLNATNAVTVENLEHFGSALKDYSGQDAEITTEALSVPRSRKKPTPWEDIECRALWQWAQYNPVLKEYLYHVPNGDLRNVVIAKKLKAIGTRAGVHDYHLPVPRGVYHGLWVEIKAQPPHDAAVSKEQIEWKEKMEKQGYAVFICKGWTYAQIVFTWYLTLPEPPPIPKCPEIWELSAELIS